MAALASGKKPVLGAAPPNTAIARTAPSTLEDSAIPLSKLRSQGRKELLDVLQAARGRKALVLDTALRGLLAHIVPEGTNFLRQHGVVHLCRGLQTDLTFVTPEGRDDEPDNILYFVRPSLSNMRMLSAQLKKRNGKRQMGGGRKALTRSASESGSGGGPYQPKEGRHLLYFVPHKTFLCEQALSDEGVLERFAEVGECHLDLFPLDTDLVSLEMDTSFKDAYVDGDSTMLTTVARSLQKLEENFGVIPHVKAKGTHAAVALQRFFNLKRQQEEEKRGDEFATTTTPSSSHRGTSAPEIDTLVLLDRAVDLVTPLLTPLTYEGLLNECLGIQHGAIKVDPSLVGDTDDTGGGRGRVIGRGTTPENTAGGAGKEGKGEPVTVALNSNDSLYAEIRDLHLEVLGLQLNEKAMEMRQTYARVKEETRDGSLNEIHDVVKSIPALQQKYKGLNLHINIAEFLKPTTGHVRFQQRWQLERSMLEGETCYEDVEEMVAAYEPVDQVLRLLALQSLTAGGIKASKYELLKREIIQSYGYEYLFALTNMEQAGLLRKADLQLSNVMFGSIGASGFSSTGGSGNAWASLRRLLRLVKENVNTQVPDDIAYVSSGYAPLSVRLLQLIQKPGWASCSDVFKFLPGPTLECTQTQENTRRGGAPLSFMQELDRLLGTACSGTDGDIGGRPQPSVTPVTQHLGLSAAETGGKILPNGKTVMMVYFIGGVSFMEIAAMRYLSRHKDFPYSIIVCTTKLISGNLFIESVFENFRNSLGRS